MHIPTCMPYRLSSTGRQKHSPNSCAVLQANTGKHHAAKQPANKSKEIQKEENPGNLGPCAIKNIIWSINVAYLVNVNA